MAKSLFSLLLLLLQLQLLVFGRELATDPWEGLEACFVQTNVVVRSKEVNETTIQWSSGHLEQVTELHAAHGPTPTTFKEFKEYLEHLLSDRWAVRTFEIFTAISLASTACIYLFGVVLPFQLGRRVAQANWVISELMKGVGFLVLLPVSYPFALKLGRGAFMSGLLLSAWPLGSIFGQMIARRSLSEANQQGGNYKELRTFIVWSQLLLGLSFYGYVAVVWSPVGQNNDALWWTLIALRIISGTASGCNCLASSYMALGVTLPQEVMNLQTIVTAAKNLGLSLAVLISSIAMRVFGDEDIWLQGTVPLMPLLYLTIVTTLAFVLCMPLTEPSKNDFETKQDVNAAPEHTASLMASLDLEAREKLVYQAEMFNYERSVSVAAIEVCSSLISEVEYGFSDMLVGWVFGAITLGAFMLNIAIARFMSSDMKTRARAMFLQAFFGACATLFVFNGWPWWTLYIADTCIYAFANAANGIANGFALLAAVPDSPYSKEAFMDKTLFAVSISRLLSAPLARGWYDLFGRNGYALAQFLITCAGLNCIRKMHVILADVQPPKEVESTSKGS